MLYEIDSNGYFVCDLPHAESVSPTVVDKSPQNADGTGMSHNGTRSNARWTGTWDDVNQKWVGGGWVDDGAAQLDSDLAAQNIMRIKVKAGEVIISRLPEWKQRNLLARKSELQDKLISGLSLTIDEQSEWDVMMSDWEWAKSVRSTSDDAELNNTNVDDIIWPS